MASKIDAKSSQAWLQSMLEIDRVLHHFAVVANPTEVAHGSDCHMHRRKTPVNGDNLEALLMPQENYTFLVDYITFQCKPGIQIGFLP